MADKFDSEYFKEECRTDKTLRRFRFAQKVLILFLLASFYVLTVDVLLGVVAIAVWLTGIFSSQGLIESRKQEIFNDYIH